MTGVQTCALPILAFRVKSGITSIISDNGRASQCPSARHCSVCSPVTYFPCKCRTLTGWPVTKDLEQCEPPLTTTSIPFSDRRWILIVRRIGDYKSIKCKTIKIVSEQKTSTINLSQKAFESNHTPSLGCRIQRTWRMSNELGGVETLLRRTSFFDGTLPASAEVDWHQVKSVLEFALPGIDGLYLYLKLQFLSKWK